MERTVGFLDIFNRRSVYLAVLALIAVFPSVNPLKLTGPVAIVFLGVFLFVTALAFSDTEDKKFLFKLFVIALVLRIGLCLTLRHLAFFKSGHGFFLGADDYGYSLNALDIVRHWKITGQIPEDGSLMWMPYAGDLNYTYFLSHIYYYIEENTLIPLFMNCTLGALVIFIIYAIADNICGRKIARLAAIFTAFWPSIFLWSTQNLREPMTIFFIAAFVWAFVNMLSKFRISYIAVIVCSFLFFKTMRPIILIFLILSVTLTLIALLRPRRLLKIFAIVLVVTLCFPSSYLKSRFLNFFHNALPRVEEAELMDAPTSRISIIESINYARHVRTWSADTAFLKDYEITSFAMFLLFVPLSLPFALFAPFPWQMFKLSQIVAVFEMSFWYLLVPFTLMGVIKAFRYKQKRKEVVFIFVFVCTVIGILTLIEGNIGTLFRHRSFMWPYLLIFTAVGLNSRAKKDDKSIS